MFMSGMILMEGLLLVYERDGLDVNFGILSQHDKALFPGESALNYYRSVILVELIRFILY